MKKLTAFVLSAMMVLSLAACGAKTETPADTSTPAADATKPAEVANYVDQDKDHHHYQAQEVIHIINI